MVGCEEVGSIEDKKIEDIKKVRGKRQEVRPYDGSGFDLYFFLFFFFSFLLFPPETWRVEVYEMNYEHVLVPERTNHYSNVYEVDRD